MAKPILISGPYMVHECALTFVLLLVVDTIAALLLHQVLLYYIKACLTIAEHAATSDIEGLWT